MKIVRLGMTETSILFLTFISRNFKLDPEIKTGISQTIKNLLNWLYSTSGYYDKAVTGNNFDFDVTAMTLNYFKFIKHLEASIANCEITQFYVHGGFVTHLLNQFKDEFIEKYKIRNFTILNDIPFKERIPDIFRRIAKRRVLVISAFDGLIRQQVESGNIKKIYPKFPKIVELKTLKFPYCFHNNGPHTNYFETLDAFFAEIKTVGEFDIALLSCGAYGHMLCHKIDAELKKDAIYVGGSIQELFGIISKREKDRGEIEYNEHWITEIPESYRPADYKSIENGCYW